MKFCHCTLEFELSGYNKKVTAHYIHSTISYVHACSKSSMLTNHLYTFIYTVTITGVVTYIVRSISEGYKLTVVRKNTKLLKVTPY